MSESRKRLSDGDLDLTYRALLSATEHLEMAFGLQPDNPATRRLGKLAAKVRTELARVEQKVRSRPNAHA